jgi:hypothetical protein
MSSLPSLHSKALASSLFQENVKHHFFSSGGICLAALKLMSNHE